MRRLLSLAITFLMVLGLFGGPLANESYGIGPDYEVSSDSPTEQGESIIFSFTNHTNDAVELGEIQIDVEGTIIDLEPEDYLYDGTIAVDPGQTEYILEIAPGMPGTWRGFYGGGFDFHFLITVDGEVWTANVVSHTVLEPTFEEGEVSGGDTAFLSDNEDGTATLAVEVADHEGNPYEGLAVEAFLLELHDTERLDKEDPAEAPVGTIISVTEIDPGKYHVIWAYDTGSHQIDVLVLGRLLGWGLPVVITDGPDYEVSSDSPTEQGEPIIFSFTNHTNYAVELGEIQIDVEGTIEDLEPGDYLYTGTITIGPGQTVDILEIEPGMPGTWRGFYGGTPYFHFLINVDNEVWRANVVSHNVIEPTFDEGEVSGGFTSFLSDNKNGTATIHVEVFDHEGKHYEGLNAHAFLLELHDIERLDKEDTAEAPVGTIISVTEVSPGRYNVIWAYDAGSHAIDVLVLGRLVGWGQFTNITKIEVPEKFGEIESNLSEIENLENTEKEVVFTSPGMGSIVFGPGLNLIESQEQLEALEDSLKIYYDEDSNKLVASVDTTALSFLAGHSATVVFNNVSEKLGVTGLNAGNFREYLDIAVYDNDGILQEDISDFFNWDDVVYDADEDTLYLPVNHFTDYVLGAVEPTTEDAEEETEEAEALPETSGNDFFYLLGLIPVGIGIFMRKRIYA
ncbi:hypothetical protein [Dethiobacter alkaliphilus]|uniref:hypothetical protein n=1 Tax=Dethiobacter alkaliphilus TaxID=427926 RepID=UPI002227E74A|nr:hypothetical protein [Dethiobacter alkaliphilus]MCW3490308.1 hypothetical protein [Dethiobacter alkaliphilus]